MNILTFNSEKDFIQQSTDYILNICNKTDGILRIGLSGGSTPKTLYKSLSENEDIPFDRIEFFILDERYVPLDHPNSNYKMIYESLVRPIEIRLLGFYFFDTSLSIHDSLEKYKKELNGISFDICILGMGTDAHIASLFPNTDALNEKNRNVAHTVTDVHDIHDRLTITLPLIVNCKNNLLLLKGDDKKTAFEMVQNSDKSINELPAKSLLKKDNLTIHILN